MDRAAVSLEPLLADAVQAGVFPGAVAGVSVREDGREARLCVRAGVLEAGGEPTGWDTVYDLASLTKPVIALCALKLVQRGIVDMSASAATYVPELAGTPGGDAPLQLLLSHRAGLTPWGGLYREIPGPHGSAETRAFMLREAASRVDPGPPKPSSVYSDLGYMVAGEALSRASGLSLDQLVAREVTRPLGIERQMFYAAALDINAHDLLLTRVAPTEQCAFRTRLLRGEVHDENAGAFGGIAGHAGLFGTVEAVLSFGRGLLDALEGRPSFVDRLPLVWALRARPGGGHVVGFDTKSAEGSSAGARFSPRSFGHLGFTGTSIWCDPTRSLCAVLLSNRVHPTRDNIAIRAFRPRFHDAVVDALFASEPTLSDAG